jgi:hypothetical protein
METAPFGDVVGRHLDVKTTLLGREYRNDVRPSSSRSGCLRFRAGCLGCRFFRRRDHLLRLATAGFFTAFALTAVSVLAVFGLLAGLVAGLVADFAAVLAGAFTGLSPDLLAVAMDVSLGWGL